MKIQGGRQLKEIHYFIKIKKSIELKRSEEANFKKKKVFKSFFIIFSIVSFFCMKYVKIKCFQNPSGQDMTSFLKKCCCQIILKNVQNAKDIAKFSQK